MKCIGTMVLHASAEIEKSFVCIGFETLDRDMFDAEKCYGPLSQTGIKHARCQTGWIKCEKEKGVYDFEWLDKIVDNLLIVIGILLMFFGIRSLRKNIGR